MRRYFVSAACLVLFSQFSFGQTENVAVSGSGSCMNGPAKVTFNDPTECNNTYKGTIKFSSVSAKDSNVGSEGFGVTSDYSSQKATYLSEGHEGKILNKTSNYWLGIHLKDAKAALAGCKFDFVFSGKGKNCKLASVEFEKEGQMFLDFKVSGLTENVTGAKFSLQPVAGSSEDCQKTMAKFKENGEDKDDVSKKGEERPFLLFLAKTQK